MSEISSLLNDIISGGTPVVSTVKQTPDAVTTFNPDEVKEKLAFGIIRDMTKAMMNDEKLSDEKMLDDSIMDHVKNDYKGTCFGYLNDAQKRLKSPLFEDIIFKINEYALMEEADFNAKGYVTDNHKIDSKILDDNPDYKTFRQKLAAETSNMLVEDVAAEVLKKKETPVFDIDDKLKPVTEEEPTVEPSADTDTGSENIDTGTDVDMGSSAEVPMNEEDQELQTAPVEDFNDNQMSESVILRMTGNIVMESYMNGSPMTTSKGMEKAICEYCVQQLCFLLKDRSARNPYSKYLK